MRERDTPSFWQKCNDRGLHGAERRDSDHLRRSCLLLGEGDVCIVVVFFLRFYLFIFRQRGREGERDRNINVWLSLLLPPLGTWPATQACALDWKLNRRPFGSQAGTQSTEPHQPGLFSCALNIRSAWSREACLIRVGGRMLSPCLCIRWAFPRRKPCPSHGSQDWVQVFSMRKDL